MYRVLRVVIYPVQYRVIRCSWPVLSVGGSIIVYSNILDSTPRINSESMKYFDDPESAKSWKPSAS